MKKLAVFFPGIGYTADMPLLYYSRKAAQREGFEIRLLPYTGFPHKINGDAEKMKESFRLALTQSREMLSSVDLTEYDRLLFVGKSIGTAAAAAIAAGLDDRDRIHMLLYTPLEATFSFPVAQALVFTGDADPWVAEGRIPELCRERDLPCHVIHGANHSLETGQIPDDIENLEKIMKKTAKFIRRI